MSDSQFKFLVYLSCREAAEEKKAKKKEYTFKNKKEAIEAFKMLLKDKVNF